MVGSKNSLLQVTWGKKDPSNLAILGATDCFTHREDGSAFVCKLDTVKPIPHCLIVNIETSAKEITLDLVVGYKRNYLIDSQLLGNLY